MSSSKFQKLKGAEIRQLADLCVSRLNMMDPHGFGVCWQMDAYKLNEIARILGVPYRIPVQGDTRVGPKLRNINENP